MDPVDPVERGRMNDGKVPFDAYASQHVNGESGHCVKEDQLDVSVIEDVGRCPATRDVSSVDEPRDGQSHCGPVGQRETQHVELSDGIQTGRKVDG